MKLLLPVLHGLALTAINIAAILFEFAIYQLVRPANQIAVQAPVAALASILSGCDPLTIPKHRPVKSVYVRKALARIRECGEPEKV